MTELRKDRRAPASLKVKYKSATVDEFIEHFGTDVSRGGIFIKTKKPLDTGALLKFEFQLQDGSAVIHGVGRVAWRRLESTARPDLPAGMGIKFFKLSDSSRLIVERIESRNAGSNSRYDLNEAAEFAPPLSAAPPPDGTSGVQAAANGRDRGSGSGLLTMPPPPANSSIPPALADVPPARPSPRPSPRPAVDAARSLPGRPASGRQAGAGLPKGTAASGPLGSDRAGRAVGAAASRNRDPSESLASALQAGGAGADVRAQAQSQAERARRDPQSVDLARQLFGDIAGEAPVPGPGPVAPAAPVRAQSGSLGARTGAAGEPRSKAPAVSAAPARSAAPAKQAASGQPARASEPGASARYSSGAWQSSGPASARQSAHSVVDSGAHETVRPAPVSAGSVSEYPESALDSLPPPAAAEALPLPGEPAPAALDLPSLRASPRSSDSAARTSTPSFADKIPSIEQLVDEASIPDEDRTPARAYTSVIPAGESAAALASAPASDEHPRLTLAMGGHTLPPTADKPARSRLVLFAALAFTVLLVGLGGYVLMQRNAASTSAASAPAVPASAPEEQTPEAAAPPTEPAAPPPTAAEPSAQPANEPAPAAAALEPGPEVEVTVTARPRGAEVYLAGQRVGVAPIKLRLPSNVPAELELRSSGYAPLQRSVTPRAGLPPEAFELQPLEYQLIVETDPPGAVVSANRRSAVAPAPVELGHLEGPIQVTIDKPGFQRVARVVKLDDFTLEDGRMRVKLTLPLVAMAAPAARRRPAAAPGPAPNALPEAPPEPPSTASAAPEPPPVVQVRPEPEPEPEAPAPN